MTVERLGRFVVRGIAPWTKTVMCRFLRSGREGSMRLLDERKCPAADENGEGQDDA
jgi:hypothetical protein